MKLISTTGRNASASRKLLDALSSRRNAAYERALPAARRIVEGVRKGGDAALRRYVARFDPDTQSSQLQISPEEMHTALDNVSPAFERALRTATKNIRAFAEHQKPKDWNFAPAGGVTVGQRIRPISSIGCYVPSGRYPLPSTLLMTAIPAQVAGVERIAVVSPRPAPETLAAAAMLGITEFYRVGGAHAVAALAYGTKSIPRVDKIVGPGNAFVTAAKRLVAFDCAIDMLAGPTEIVVTSESGNADDIASDLIAQAEHDPDAEAIFITTSSDLAAAVIANVRQRTRTNKAAAESIARNGLAIVAASLDEARSITNALAPEHLTVDTMEDLAWVKNAGSVFIGRFSAQALGDYLSGPNHTLPTSGLARVRGGLSVMDFLKVITVQECTAEGLRHLAPSAIALAEAEGLHGHAEAIRTRLTGER
jgi:histidinol dehydrogenase